MIMKVKLTEGVKFWHWDDFSIRKNEIKECPDDIRVLSNGILEPVETKKKEKKISVKEKHGDDML